MLRLVLRLSACWALVIGGAIGGLSALRAPEAAAETPPDILVIANAIDAMATLDPQVTFETVSYDLLNNVYSRLVRYDPDDPEAGLLPDIAESWTISEDGRVITFRIREGLSFHSGNPVTARDVEYSLHRVIALNQTPAFLLKQFGFTVENMGALLRAVDDRTFRLETPERFAPSLVLSCLSGSVGSVVDSVLVRSHEVDGDWGSGWLETRSAGSGAYRVVSWVRNERYVLEANPDFWLGAPEIPRVIVRHVPESSLQRLLLEQGDVDIARNLSPEDIEAVSALPGIKVGSERKGRIAYFAMNVAHPPFANETVRRAMRYAVDYEGMAESFLKGQFSVHQAVVPEGYLGAVTDRPFTYDPARARELLEEAGYGEGFPVEIAVRTEPYRLEIAQTLHRSLSEIGIDAQLLVESSGQNRERYRNRNFEIWVGGWGPEYPDPHALVGAFVHNTDNSDEANQRGMIAWRTSWYIPELSAKTDRAAQETDEATRAALYREIQLETRETAPFVVMFQQIEQNARRAGVTGFSVGGPTSFARFWTAAK